MNETTLSYLAGILDGEGWFSIQRARHSSAYTYNASVGVANTNKKLMDWLHARFGGKVIQREPGHFQHGRKIRYEWRLSGRQAVALCITIKPYLVLKPERAQVLIELYELISNKYRGVGVPSDVQNKRELLYLRLRELNGTSHKINSPLARR